MKQLDRLSQQSPQTRIRGFTLIELIFVLLVAGILVSIAVPSYNDSMSKSKVNAPYKSLRSAVALAKTEAVSRNQQVVVCASADQSTCGSDWNKGWLVFVDANRNKTYDASAGNSGGIADEILSVGSQVNNAVDIKFIGNKDGKKASKIIFTRQGYATGHSGDFIFCSNHDEKESDKAKNARALIIIESGVMRMSSDGTDAGQVHENSKGNNISC